MILFEIASHRDGQLARTLSWTESLSVGCTAARLTGIPALIPNRDLYTCSYAGNAPLATVMVEIWLYLVYAVAAWLLLRAIRERTLWIAIASLSVAGFTFVWLSSEHRDWWYNGSLLSYLPLWWIGAALVGELPRRLVRAVTVSALGVWIAATVLLDGSPLASFALSEVRILAFGTLAGLVIRALDERVQHLPRPVTGAGRAGYSLYAFHAPILIVLIVVGIPWWAVALVATSSGIALFHLYEYPLTRCGRALARRIDTTPLLVETRIARAPAAAMTSGTESPGP
jgi:hypothetical protein